MFEKLTDDRHGHENTEINNVANARAAAEAEASPGTSPTTATATFGIHFDHLGARMLAMWRWRNAPARPAMQGDGWLFDVR